MVLYGRPPLALAGLLVIICGPLVCLAFTCRVILLVNHFVAFCLQNMLLKTTPLFLVNEFSDH